MAGFNPLKIFFRNLNFCGSEGDELFEVIGLSFNAVSGAIALDFSAFSAFVENYISFFCVRYNLNCVHNTAAGVGAVSGIFVHVKGAKAEGTVVTRGAFHGKDLFFTVLADKARIVF